MSDYERMSRDELILAARELEAALARAAEQAPRWSSLSRILDLEDESLERFEQCPLPMYIFDPATLEFLKVNDAAVNLYGYSGGEFLGMRITDIWSEGGDAAVIQQIRSHPASYLNYRGPRRHRVKSGDLLEVEIVGQDVLYNGRKARAGLVLDVTERKRTEQELRESNAFLRSMIESSRDCIKVLDLDGRLLSMNSSGQRLREIADLTPLLNTSWVDFWRGADREAACNAVAAAAAGNTGTFEGYSPTRTGIPKWWDVIITPILDPAGEPEKLLAVSRDITERKQVVRALHESESKYRNLVESSSDLIWSADAAGRITFINEAVRRIYGFEPGEMLGRPVVELLGDGHWKKSFGFFRTMLARDRSLVDYECEVRRKNGKRVILSSNAIVLRDAEGNRIGVTGISKDITARKQMEAELRQSEERFRQLAENIRQVFWIATLNHDQVVYISPAYEEIWGRSRHSLYRDPLDWMRSVHPDDRPAVQKGIENLARGESLNAEYRIIHPDGTLRWIRDRSYPMKGGDGTSARLRNRRGHTDRKRAEQERLDPCPTPARCAGAGGSSPHQEQPAGRRRPAAPEDPEESRRSALGLEEAIAQLQSVAVVYGLQGTRPDGLLSLAEMVEAICASAESLIGGRVERVFERKAQRPACVAGSEAVSVAVALNELVFNALKHQPAPAGRKRAQVALRETRDAARDTHRQSRAAAEAGSTFPRAWAVGTGLGLVRTLLASPGGRLEFNGGRDQSGGGARACARRCWPTGQRRGQRGGNGRRGESKKLQRHILVVG